MTLQARGMNDVESSHVCNKTRKKSQRLNGVSIFKLYTYLSSLETDNGHVKKAMSKIAIDASSELKIKVTASQVEYACKELGLKSCHVLDKKMEVRNNIDSTVLNLEARISKIEQFLQFTWGDEFSKFVVR